MAALTSLVEWLLHAEKLEEGREPVGAAGPRQQRQAGGRAGGQAGGRQFAAQQAPYLWGGRAGGSLPRSKQPTYGAVLRSAGGRGL